MSPLIAYYRVSTERQGRSGLGLEAQHKAVATFAAAEGFTVLAEFTEVETGKGSGVSSLKVGSGGSPFGIADLATMLVAKSKGADVVATMVPDSPDVTAVAESGIRTRADLDRLSEAGYHAFLVGERLIAQPDPGAALRELRAC